MKQWGHVAMLCHASEEAALFRVGFLRITPEVLNAGANRDRKRTLNKLGRDSIAWAWMEHHYPKNILLMLEPSSLELIMGQSSGQARLDNLFRLVQQELIPRGVVYTVAQQKDPMKRIRYNGGSRSNLQPEGILILGDYKRHQRIAHALELPVCHEGDSLSVRVYPAEPGFSGRTVTIGNHLWRVATQSDPVVPAPRIPME